MAKKKSIWDDNFNSKLKHLPKMKNVGWKGDPNRNAKNILQEYCQKFRYPLPEYNLIKTEGSSHEPWFIVAVIVEVGINNKSEKLYLTGEGNAVIFAEFKAAEKACDMLELEYKPSDF